MFGAGSHTWLVGSRADDSARGGDVDLFVEAEAVPPQGRVRARLGADVVPEEIDSSVDLLVRYPGEAEQPIFRIAKMTGVSLLQLPNRRSWPYVQGSSASSNRPFTERTLSRVRVLPALDDADDLDHYEALTARFGRLQDTSLGPFRLIAILELEERKTERVRDLLNYMEKLGIIDSSDEWAEMRPLRNAIAHEYWSNRAQLAEMFTSVAGFSRKLLGTVTRLHQYATRFPQI